MAYQIVEQKEPGIVLVDFYPPHRGAQDSRMVNDDLYSLGAKLGRPVEAVLNIPDSVDFGAMVSAMGEAKNIPADFFEKVHPILVLASENGQLVVEALKQPQYGSLNLTVSETVEHGLQIARERVGVAAH